MKKEETLNKAIINKIDEWKRTRENRIHISERFKNYDSIWNILMLLMNSTAIFLVFISIKYPLRNGLDSVISGCFSIYIILLQYFLSNQDYKTRSLRFHYEQLEIESLRYDLKKLLHEDSLFLKLKQYKYDQIIQKYVISLKNNENHGKIDDKNRKQKIAKDYTTDNILIYLNIIIFIVTLIYVVISYVQK